MLIRTVIAFLTFTFLPYVDSSSANSASPCSKEEMIFSGEVTNEAYNGVFNSIINSCLKNSIETTLIVSSGGGDVSSAIAIYDSVNLYKKAELTTIAAGNVASSAVLIFLSGQKRQIMPNAFIFLHQIQTQLDTATESALREKLEYVEALKRSYVTILTKETLLSKKEVLSMMKSGKALSAEEAVQYGFADKIMR